MSRRPQTGFSLITLIFLLVVIGGLIGYMLNISSVQHATVAQSYRGALAMQAVRTGMDYAVYQVLKAGVGCGGVSTLDSGDWAADELDDFSVSFVCNASDHEEAGQTITVFDITATAIAGNYLAGSRANPDYVSRRIRIAVSQTPP